MKRSEMTLEWMKNEVNRSEKALYKAYTAIELTSRMKALGLPIANDLNKKTAVDYYVKGLKRAIEEEETAEKAEPTGKKCFKCKGEVTKFKGVERCETCGQDQSEKPKEKSKTAGSEKKEGSKKKDGSKKTAKKNEKKAAGSKVSGLLLHNIDKRFRTKSEKDDLKEKLLKEGPYTGKQLNSATWWALKMLAGAMGVEVFGKGRDEVLRNVVKGQDKK